MFKLRKIKIRARLVNIKALIAETKYSFRTI